MCILRSFVTVCVCCLCMANAVPSELNHGVNLPTTRPLNIAHRGASGTLPDHTSEAYRKAIEYGADVIECDVVLTADLQPICLHEAWMSRTTDVESHPEFADKLRTYTLTTHSPQNVTDWFTVDFTLQEIKTLRMRQRFDFRDHTFDGQYQITTLQEYIDIAKNADRNVGVYPELKSPSLLNSILGLTQNGQRFEDIVLNVLHENGYDRENSPCFVQSFEEESLVYLKGNTSLPLVMLISDDEILSDRLEAWGQYFYGIGVWKVLIARYYSDETGYKAWISNSTDLIQKAHSAGLKVHAYTFRNEDRYLAWDFHQDPLAEFRYFEELGVDGFFTDFPATLWQYLQSTESMVCSAATFSSFLPVFVASMLFVLAFI